MFANAVRGDRSKRSIHFEVRLLSMSLPAKIVNRHLANLSRLDEFASHMAVLKPDIDANTVRFEEVGAGVNALFGRNLSATEYLEIVAPSARQLEIETVELALKQPCGFWQLVPARTNDGRTIALELTGFPTSGADGREDEIVALINPHLEIEPVPLVVAMQHPSALEWLDLGFGLPLNHTILVD